MVPLFQPTPLFRAMVAGVYGSLSAMLVLSPMFSWATHAALIPLKSLTLPASISDQSGSQSFGPFNEAPRRPYSFFICSKSRPSTSACGAVSLDAGIPAVVNMGL